MNLVLLGVAAYVLAQLCIGVAVSRRSASEEDFLLAGRSLGYGLATFTFFATWFGAESCLSASSKIYSQGLSGGSADPFGYGLCIVFMGLVFAMPLWRRRLTTLADLFRLRYSVGVERLAVLIMVPTSVLWAAAQIRGFGQVLAASSDFNPAMAITIAAGVAVLYTTLGGMRAVVVTDLVQGLLVVLGLVVLFTALFPGWSHVEAAWAKVEPERLRLIPADQPLWATVEAWAIPICGSVVAQELVARVLSCRSPEVARRSALMGGGLYLLVGLIPVFLGLAGVALLPDLEDPEQILPLLARQHLSAFLYILFAGALVSAILSTVDSTLLAASSLVAHNVIVPLRPALDEAAKVRCSRLGVLAFGAIAWWLALQADSIFELVESASSFGSAGIFVVMLFGLFSRWGGTRAAYGALIAGVTVWMVGSLLPGCPVVYLISLGAALAAYLIGGCMDGRLSRSDGPAPA